MGKAAPTVYEIMHGDRKVAQIDQYGHSKIYFESFMPYNLYLEDEDDNDIDTLVNNLLQLFCLKWLRNKFIRTILHCFYHLCLLPGSRYHNHRYISEHCAADKRGLRVYLRHLLCR